MLAPCPRSTLLVLAALAALAACERAPDEHFEGPVGDRIEPTGGTAVNDTTPYRPGDPDRPTTP